MLGSARESRPLRAWGQDEEVPSECSRSSWGWRRQEMGRLRHFALAPCSVATQEAPPRAEERGTFYLMFTVQVPQRPWGEVRMGVVRRVPQHLPWHSPALWRAPDAPLSPSSSTSRARSALMARSSFPRSPPEWAASGSLPLRLLLLVRNRL